MPTCSAAKLPTCIPESWYTGHARRSASSGNPIPSCPSNKSSTTSTWNEQYIPLHTHKTSRKNKSAIFEASKPTQSPAQLQLTFPPPLSFLPCGSCEATGTLYHIMRGLCDRRLFLFLTGVVDDNGSVGQKITGIGPAMLLKMPSQVYFIWLFQIQSYISGSAYDRTA